MEPELVRSASTSFLGGSRVGESTSVRDHRLRRQGARSECHREPARVQSHGYRVARTRGVRIVTLLQKHEVRPLRESVNPQVEA